MYQEEMYLDESIKLDFEIPEPLNTEIKEMDKAYYADDIIKWDYYHESIGTYAKIEHACGRLTHEQLMKIYERYGTAG